jgi:hypothetical protein
MKDVEKLFVERRDWPRVALDALIHKASVRLPGVPTGEEPSVEVVNFSEAGAGILFSHPVERGIRVTLEIAGKEIPPLGFQAEVRWVGGSPVSTGKYAAGLKFIDLDEQRRVQLRDFVKTLQTHGKRSD